MHNTFLLMAYQHWDYFYEKTNPNWFGDKDRSQIKCMSGEHLTPLGYSGTHIQQTQMVIYD